MDHTWHPLLTVEVSASPVRVRKEAGTMKERWKSDGKGGNKKNGDKKKKSTHRVLDAMQVGVDATTLRERQRGMPGEKLTGIDQELLELKPFRIFRPGEIVAVAMSGEEAEDDAELSATEEGRGDNKDSHDSKISSATAETVRYGRVLSTSNGDVGGTSSGVRKVQVRVSAEKSVTRLSTQLYSFRSARDGGIGAGSPTTPSGRGSGSGTPSFLRKRDQQGTPISAMRSLPPPPPPSSDTAAAGGTDEWREQERRQGAEAVDDKAVSERDVIGAISGLLARTGIPMSLQENDLMARVLELQASNKRAESALQQERQQHLETRHHLAGAVNVFHCGVCLTNDIDHVITPCGHPICETCMKQLPRNKCPFCRVSISKTVKLYLPQSENDDDL